ncbi:MAG: prephenate dehydrogenase/arogenate dehydrogenase family protein [Spirochaetaceae bacterium]
MAPLRRDAKTATIRAMHIGVYGLGRFGYFWASLLAEHFSVRAYTRTVDRPTPPGVERVPLEELGRCHTIFLCVAISAMEPVCRELAPLLRDGTTVADTCSVKVYPVEVMRRTLPPAVSILATHPMFGPDSAADGTAGLPLIYWPERMDPAEADPWLRWFARLGLRTIRMSPDEHDHEAAYTQGITHFIGRVLEDLSVRPSPIGTLGYRKILEVVEQTCNDPLQLFLDLQRFNPYTSEMRSKLKASLERVLSQFDE